jgi:hypothetical protein
MGTTGMEWDILGEARQGTVRGRLLNYAQRMVKYRELTDADFITTLVSGKRI